MFCCSGEHFPSGKQGGAWATAGSVCAADFRWKRWPLDADTADPMSLSAASSKAKLPIGMTFFLWEAPPEAERTEN